MQKNAMTRFKHLQTACPMRSSWRLQQIRCFDATIKKLCPSMVFTVLSIVQMASNVKVDIAREISEPNLSCLSSSFFDLTSNKCHASSNKCLTSSNKKLVEIQTFSTRPFLRSRPLGPSQYHHLDGSNPRPRPKKQRTRRARRTNEAANDCFSQFKEKQVES